MATVDKVTTNQWVLALLRNGPVRRLRLVLADAINRASLGLGRSNSSAVKKAANWSRRAAVRLANSIIFYPAGSLANPGGRRVLIASHQLDRTGAPKIVFELATIAIEEGWAVTVVAPSDGSFRTDLNRIGADVVIAHSMTHWQRFGLARAARVFDLAICNTIVVWTLAQELAKRIPTLLYVHEVSILQETLDQAPGVRDFLRKADIWCGSELSADLVRPLQPEVMVVPYGINPIVADAGEQRSDPAGPEPLQIGIFGSIHPRKGQDLAVAAVKGLRPELRRLVHLRLYGEDFRNHYSASLFADLPENVTYEGALEPEAYRRAILACDAVLVSSRDDTLPLVSLDALSSGRVLMCTSTTGTSLYLEQGVSGYIAQDATAEALGDMLGEALGHVGNWPQIGERGREVFRRNFAKERFRHIVIEMFERKAAETV